MRERELTEESTFSNHNRADAFRLSTAFFSAWAVLLVSLFAVLAYLQHAVLSLRVSDFEFRIRAYGPSSEIFTMSKIDVSTSQRGENLCPRAGIRPSARLVESIPREPVIDQ